MKHLFCSRCPYTGGCTPGPAEWCEQGLAQAEPWPVVSVSSDAQPTPPITADALQAFLAPGVTTWAMTSADLEKLGEWINERRTQ